MGPSCENIPPLLLTLMPRHLKSIACTNFCFGKQIAMHFIFENETAVWLHVYTKGAPPMSPLMNEIKKPPHPTMTHPITHTTPT